MKKKMISLLLALVMIASMIPAAFAAAGFSDVQEDDWFASSVAYAVEHNLMSGVGNGRFDPNAPMTRAMAVTVLYNMSGKPAPSAGNPFADVPAGSWFADACIWAAENGITSGVSATRFGPNQLVTREQLVVFLYKYAQMKGVDLTYIIDLSSFPDASRLSDWAKDAMRWAIQNSIISGNQNGYLVPQSSATRAECATILMRFDQLVSGEGVPETEPTVPETDPTVPETDPTEPEMDIEELNDPEHLEAIAQAAIKHINLMRQEEGNAPLDYLPGMQEVAMYRAVQLTTNYAHDTDDITEAHNKFEYGEFYEDPLDPQYNRWHSDASESIMHGSFGHPDDFNYESIGFIDYIDYSGWMIADTFHNSEGHWQAIGSSRKAVIGVGIHFGEDGELFCCVMVGNEDCRKYG